MNSLKPPKNIKLNKTWIIIYLFTMFIISILIWPKNIHKFQVFMKTLLYLTQILFLDILCYFLIVYVFKKSIDMAIIPVKLCFFVPDNQFSAGKFTHYHLCDIKVQIKQHMNWNLQIFILIGQMSRVFTNDLGGQGSIPGWVIPKTQKNGTWCGLA